MLHNAFSCTMTSRTAAIRAAVSPRCTAAQACDCGEYRRRDERAGHAVVPPQCRAPSSDTVLRILAEVDHLVIETLEGQALELGWVRDNDLTVGPADYLRLVLKKTAWYSFIHPLRIGALVADGRDQHLDRFDRFGYLLGLAFQITDDVLNLKGRVERYGKEIGGDLWEGKRTLVLAHALSHVGGTDRDWIADFLGRPRERRLPSEVMRLHDLFDRTGSIDWAVHSAKAFADAALQEFHSTAFQGIAAGPDLDWLRSCVSFLVERDA
jgi:geranylgeranyl pyrophosphate synthase